MTQADSVHSTPPKNTPVDPTRRRFLSQAAGMAAGGTALALATVSPAPATPARASLQDVIDDFPELTAAARALDAANDDVIAGRKAYTVIDAKLKQWCETHAMPRKPRAYRRWVRWCYRIRDESGIEPAQAAVVAALRVFQANQIAVAEVKPRNLSELALKAALSVIYEDGSQPNNLHSPVIARSVGYDACRLAGMLS